MKPALLISALLWCGSLALATDAAKPRATPSPRATSAEEKELPEAREAFVKKQYAKAIEIAKRSVDRKAQEAWRIIGASACSSKDKPVALEAYEKLDREGKALVEYICGRHHVVLR